MTARSLALAALAALLGGCTAGGPGLDPPALAPVLTETPGHVQVWAHDDELEQTALDAADRVLRATGAVVEVNAASTMTTAVPIFWSDDLVTDGWLGWHAGEWIAIDETTTHDALETVVLHEILHALGAGHVDEGAGVLSPHLGTWVALTAVDLVAVCSAAACTAFVPEI